MDGVLTRREQIMDFISGFICEKGYAPSVRDIAEGCSISSSSVVQYHLKMLESQGVIHRMRKISRSITLI